MTRSFLPRVDVLPHAQRLLWPQLRPAAALGFTLYGGTAIALRLGHRESVDFDFFSEAPLNRVALTAAIPALAKATTVQDERNSWVMLVPNDEEPTAFVKLSFLGTIAFGRVGEPDFTDDGVLRVASLADLMATKVKVVSQRAEAKDYRDVAAMLNAGESLPQGLAAACTLFGPNFQPSESLKALTYFHDGDLHALTLADRTCLVDAVKAVHTLPSAGLMSKSLS